jgi:long-chain acyl-CoA synthetase
MFVHELIQCGNPNDIAIIDQNRRITYNELQNAVDICRNRLYADGVRAKKTVAIFSRNSAEYIFAHMAIASLGAIAVPVNFQLSLREIAYILKDANIRHILTYKKLELTEEFSTQEQDLQPVQLDIAHCSEPGNFSSAPSLPPSFTDHEPCVIIYTSGTTGKPKGAVLSHHNLTSNADMFGQVLHIKREDNILCVLPMYHCFAWTTCVANPLFCGATITVLNTFTPRETIRLIQQEKLSVLYAVPSICTLLAKIATPEEMKSIRYVVIGGTTLPRRIAEDFAARFGYDIIEGYGLSEASPVVTVNPPERVKVGSIGLPLPGLEVRLAGTEGEAGELLVRGETVMLGYWNLPEATKETLKNGWLHTGDIARMDEDGYLYIVDRLKDMIISMGENIYPREIEELIYAFPGIQEAAVIAIPDKLRGQASCCFYAVQEGLSVDARALKKFLQKNLALYKIPRDFRELPELPKTPTGKIAKKELSRIYEGT